MKPFVIHHYCVSHFLQMTWFLPPLPTSNICAFFSTANLSSPWRLDMWRFKNRVHTFIQLQVDNPWFDFTRRWIFELIVSTTVITSAIPRLCWRLLMKIVRRFKYRYMKIILYINVTSGRFWIRFVFQKVVGDGIVCRRAHWVYWRFELDKQKFYWGQNL